MSEYQAVEVTIDAIQRSFEPTETPCADDVATVRPTAECVEWVTTQMSEVYND